MSMTLSHGLKNMFGLNKHLDIWSLFYLQATALDSSYKTSEVCERDIQWEPPAENQQQKK